MGINQRQNSRDGTVLPEEPDLLNEAFVGLALYLRRVDYLQSDRRVTPIGANLRNLDSPE